MTGSWQTGAMALAAALVAIVVACGGGDGEDTPGQPTGNDGISVVVASPTERVTTPLPRKTSAPTPTPSATPLRVCGPNPDPASPKLLMVEDPKPEARVKIPIEVRGWGSTIGRDDQGVALAMLNAKQELIQPPLEVPPQPRALRVVPAGLEIGEYTRPFAADIVLTDITEPTPICLWIYQETTADGTPKGALQVPILVVP